MTRVFAVLRAFPDLINLGYKRELVRGINGFYSQICPPAPLRFVNFHEAGRAMLAFCGVVRIPDICPCNVHIVQWRKAKIA